MALKATFTADVTQLETAIRTAVSSLQVFQLRTDNVDQALKRMVRGLDGSAIAREAQLATAAIERIGGAHRLTESEQRKVLATLDEAMQKYRLMGQQAPESVARTHAALQQLAPATSAWGGALSKVGAIITGVVGAWTLDRVVGSVVSATSATLKWGAGLTDLSAKTGLSLGALQRWEYAARQAGTTLETVVGSSVELSRRLAEGTQGTQAAVATLGLSLRDLQRLSPDEQLERISDALAGISDHGTRAKVAVDLFGRGGKEALKLVTDGLQQAREDAERFGLVVSDDTLRAMDRLSDTWDRLTVQGRAAFARILDPFLRGIEEAIQSLQLVPDAARVVTARMTVSFVDFVDRVLKGIDQITQAVLQLAGFGQQIANALPAGSALSLVPVAAMARGVREREHLAEVRSGLAFVRQAMQLEAMQAERAVMTRTWGGTTAGAASASAAREMVTSATDGAHALRRVAEAATNASAALAVLRDVNLSDRSRFGAVSLWTGLTLQRPLAQLTQPSMVLGGHDTPWGGISRITSVMGPPPPVARADPVNKWWGQLGADLPRVIVGALQGGGSVSQALGASLGGRVFDQLGTRLGTTISTALGGKLGTLVGGAVGSAVPVLGSLLGGLAGQLVGGLFGPSRGAVLGKEADQRIADLQAQLMRQYGSLDAIRAMGPAGAALADAWGSRNVQGEQWFKARVAAFERELQLLEQQRTVQEQIAGLEAQRASLAERLVPTWDQLTAAAQRYGLDLEGIGQSVRQIGATASWRQMLEDLDLFWRAGADVGAVLDQMAASVSDLVRRSIALGTEIPENMRPYIEELARAGKLIDANGDALTDLSQLRWGKPVETEADKVRAAMLSLDEALSRLRESLDKLIEQLATGLPQAASAGAARTTDALSRVTAPEIRWGGALPDVVPMARGGIVTRPTVALLGEAGPEAIVPLSSSRGHEWTVVVPVEVDGRVIAEVIARHLPAVMPAYGF